ncbi:MAG: hypothetical protein CSA66_03890 [Proteobacteria bacterium]|nr:MAG: hypothetical protein CSA66_03890 [Pseudomonadota bacterium]
MFWITMIALLALGFVAAAPRWSGHEGVKAASSAARPAEPWIGLFGLGWAAYQLVYLLTHLAIFRVDPLFAIVYLIVLVMLGALGFFFGHAVIAKAAPGGPLQRWRDGLAPRRISLGTSAMLVAALNIVLDLIGGL